MATKPSSPKEEPLHHHPRRMSGRDPHEKHRVATPLELLFDLSFAAAFGVASAQFAEVLALGHYQSALFGFGFVSFAICWAWVNFSWFSSAYDTDDWIFRAATMVQMTGVLVLATGIPRMFASLEHHGRFDNAVLVLGYVIMRVAMVFQWLRAARQNPDRRRACLTYAATISIAQLGWVAEVFLRLPAGGSLALGAVLIIIEFVGPALGERDGGTPWHAHHIAERYSLFAIIAMGEGIAGTVAALSAVVDHQGWSIDAALVCIAGIGLTFGIWWVYYVVPSGEALHAHRDRAFPWAYGQMVIITSIVAMGAGLHVAAFFIEHKAQIGPLATVLAVAIPVALYLALIYAVYHFLIRRGDPLHVWLLLGTMAVITIAIALAVFGVPVPACLVVLAFAPFVSVVGYEMLGYQHQERALKKESRQDRRKPSR